MFPLSFEGTIRREFSGDPKEAVEQSLTALTIRLRKHKPSSLIRTLDGLRFEAGVFRFVGSWNLLAPITDGDIKITAQDNLLTVNYRITFKQMFVIVTVMVAGFLGPSIWRISGFPTLGKIVILIFFWLWLFGGNLVIVLARFPAFLRSALAEPPGIAEAARYPEPEYPEEPSYGPKYEEMPRIEPRRPKS